MIGDMKRGRVDFDEGWMDSFGKGGECSLSFGSRNMCCGIVGGGKRGIILNPNRRSFLFNIN